MDFTKSSTRRRQSNEDIRFPFPHLSPTALRLQTLGVATYLGNRCTRKPARESSLLGPLGASAGTHHYFLAVWTSGEE